MAQLLFFWFPKAQGLHLISNGVILIEEVGDNSMHIVCSREQARAHLHRCLRSKPHESQESAERAAYLAVINSSLPETSNLIETHVHGNASKIIKQLFSEHLEIRNGESDPSIPPPMPGSLLGVFGLQDSPGVFLVPVCDRQRSVCVSLIFAEDQLLALLRDCLPWAPDQVRTIARGIKDMALPLINPEQPAIHIFHDVAKTLYQILSRNCQTPHFRQEE